MNNKSVGCKRYMSYTCKSCGCTGTFELSDKFEYVTILPDDAECEFCGTKAKLDREWLYDQCEN
jgi:hypothetical protein